MKGSAVYDLRGAILQLRPCSKFFTMDLPKSMREWAKFWFYARMLEADLPAFVNKPP